MAYAVILGQPYPGDNRWPTTGERLELDPGGCELLLCMPGPSRVEIAAINAGAARFGLATFPEVAIFLHRFDAPDGRTGRWSDLAWAPHVQSEPRGISGRRGDGGHLPLVVVLVDSNTGIVRALRMVTLSPRMADALRHAVETIVPTDPESYASAVKQIYDRYPTSGMLLRQRAEVTCKGGTAREIIE